MKRVRWFLGNEKGATLVLVTLGFLVLMGFASVVIDYGIVALERRKMVTAADAGALAGARVLLESGASLESVKSAAKLAAEEYAVGNGAETAMVDVEVDDNYAFNGKPIQAVVVNVGQTKDFFFARLLGFESSDVYAEAVGTWGYVANANVFPLYLEYGNIPAGSEELHLKDDNYGANWGYFFPGINWSDAKDIISGNSNADGVNVFIGMEYETDTGGKQSIIDELTKDNGNEKGWGRLYRDYKGHDVSLEVIVPVIEILSEDGASGKLDLVVRGFVLYKIQDVVEDNSGNGSVYATNLGSEKVRGIHKNTYPGYDKGVVIGKVLSPVGSYYVPPSTSNLIQEGLGIKYSLLIK
jgi:hypothetical protein